MEFVNLKMRPALRDRLKIIAAKEGVSMVGMVEHWIVGYEVSEQVQPPRKPEELLQLSKMKVRP